MKEKIAQVIKALEAKGLEVQDLGGGFLNVYSTPDAQTDGYLYTVTVSVAP